MCPVYFVNDVTGLYPPILFIQKRNRSAPRSTSVRNAAPNGIKYTQLSALQLRSWRCC